MKQTSLALLAGFLGALLALALVGATHTGQVLLNQGPNGACVRLLEGSGNGTNRGSLCVADSIATDFTCTISASGISCS